MTSQIPELGVLSALELEAMPRLEWETWPTIGWEAPPIPQQGGDWQPPEAEALQTSECEAQEAQDGEWEDLQTPQQGEDSQPPGAKTLQTPEHKTQEAQDGEASQTLQCEDLQMPQWENIEKALASEARGMVQDGMALKTFIPTPE